MYLPGQCTHSFLCSFICSTDTYTEHQGPMSGGGRGTVQGRTNAGRIDKDSVSLLRSSQSNGREDTSSQLNYYSF